MFELLDGLPSPDANSPLNAKPDMLGES